MIPKQKKVAGFTLVESMIASAILMAFIAGFLVAFLMALRTLHSATQHYRATSIARNRIQRARAFDFDSLDLLAENEVRVDPYGNLDPAGRFRRSTRMTTNTPTPFTIRIQVGVRYPTGVGAGLSAPLVVDTLIATRM